jgi:alkanesulfonate monooxygenase SsuD/methylene tetrahydromethanopterin reductase-like flavin-dependent oxidoreductase (luciferase family)
LENQNGKHAEISSRCPRRSLGYDFFSTTESFGKDEFSCSPFPLGLYVAAAQHSRRIRFLTGIISVPMHHPAILASQVAAQIS